MPPRAVIDTNLVVSALIMRGNPSTVFSLNSIVERFEFIAPDFLAEEVANNIEKARGFTKLSPDEFAETYGFVLDQINIIPTEEFAQFLPKAMEIAPHPKDAPYLALAIAYKCPIISGDKGLKGQAKVRVISPAEALSTIYGAALPHVEP